MRLVAVLQQVSDNATAVNVVKRAFFLAYEACGGTFGRGAFQARSNATEEDVWKNVLTRGDYAGMFPIDEPNRPYGDYVFGRMMKLTCEFNGNQITIRDDVPRLDYQAWCGKYPSYLNLFEAAAKELNVVIERK